MGNELEERRFESEETETSDTPSAQNKMAEFVKKNIYDVITVLICFVYVAKGLFSIQETGKTVMEILGDGFISLLFSLLVCRLLEGKGLLEGERTENYRNAMSEYRETVKKAEPYITELEIWCKDYTEKRAKEKITFLLLPAGISYEQFTARDYDENTLSKEQLACLKKAQNYKIHYLTTSELMSGDLDNKKEKDYSKVSKKEYVKRTTGKDFVSKLIISAIFGYYTIPPLTQWNWGGALWALLQTVMFVALAVMKYLGAYNYVNDDIREKVIDKTNKLKQFVKEKEKWTDLKATEEHIEIT